MIVIKLANIPIGVDNRYKYIENYAKDYITDESPLFTVAITDEDIERMSETMLQMSAESGMKFLLRDAANVLQAEAVIVIGIQTEASECGLNCGYCGYKGCAEKPACSPCVMNGVDVGIAIGAACSKIADFRLDSRVMFSAGWAAKRLDVLNGADLVFAIPLSSSSKNPFFDRKSPRKEQPAEQPKQ